MANAIHRTVAIPGAGTVMTGMLTIPVVTTTIMDMTITAVDMTITATGTVAGSCKRL
jgi:hypothetical protein